MTTREEVSRLARQAHDKSLLAAEKGDYQLARRLLDTAAGLTKHAREMDVDAPLGAVPTLPASLPFSPGRSVSSNGAAPNGDAA